MEAVSKNRRRIQYPVGLFVWLGEERRGGSERWFYGGRDL